MTHEFVVLNDVFTDESRPYPDRCTDDLGFLLRVQVLQRCVQVPLNAETVLQKHIRGLLMQTCIRRRK